MTKDEFLRDPYRNALESGNEIPNEWLEDAWNGSSLRETLLYDWSRSVSKVGSFRLASDTWIEKIAKILSADEIPTIYEHIRDQSERLEFEWRDEFVKRFSAETILLPPSRDAMFIMDALFEVVEKGNGSSLEDLLETARFMPQARQHLAEERRGGMTLVDIAERKGRKLISALIREAIESLDVKDS